MVERRGGLHECRRHSIIKIKSIEWTGLGQGPGSSATFSPVWRCANARFLHRRSFSVALQCTAAAVYDVLPSGAILVFFLLTECRRHSVFRNRVPSAPAYFFIPYYLLLPFTTFAFEYVKTDSLVAVGPYYLLLPFTTFY